ncbi:ATP-dependent DNA helicase sgs1 [Puccinia graminis f. sp. tritici]|uniref:ATP-dependent DNA helicase sgs1 n=1 Tax=Puccinia graminis f. sp. tritici TaxID=56615 RepID=A0A5B0SNB1_PUCGR|nr:ATP-dependent DNA helicase sgs1 [Puccinia graminis f. sp. tritici]
MTPQNFEEILEHPDKSVTSSIPKAPKKKVSRPRGKKDVTLTPTQHLLAATLVCRFKAFYIDMYGKARTFLPSVLFGVEEAEAMTRNLDLIKNPQDIAKLIGGETVKGQLNMLHVCLLEFLEGEDYTKYLDDSMIQKEMEKQNKRREANQRKLPAAIPTQNATTVPSEDQTTTTSTASKKTTKPRATKAKVAARKEAREVIKAADKERKKRSDQKKKDDMEELHAIQEDYRTAKRARTDVAETHGYFWIFITLKADIWINFNWL